VHPLLYPKETQTALLSPVFKKTGAVKATWAADVWSAHALI